VRILVEEVQLDAIAPSSDGRLQYRPCRVLLNDGRWIDRVYVVDANAYIKTWGVWPEDDPGKTAIRIEQVVKVEDSPSRLPVSLANCLYKSGESGMGYCVFTVEFRDGRRQAYVTGNAIDFITVPPGLRNSDALRVIPHEGRECDPVQGPDYAWCLYGRREGAA
jgi:hypothetical protein